MSGDVTHELIDLTEETNSYLKVTTDDGYEVGLYPTKLALQYRGQEALRNIHGVAITGIEGYGLHTSTSVTRMLQQGGELVISLDGNGTRHLGRITTMLKGTLPA